MTALLRNPAYKRASVFFLMLGLSVIATAPAALFANQMSGVLSVWARSVSGTIWRSTAEDVHLGALPLGDVRLMLGPVSLLTGDPEITLRSKEAAPLTFIARVTKRGEVLNFDAEGNAQALGLVHSLDGDISVTSGRIIRSGSGCQSATGNIAANVRLPATDVVAPVTGSLECQSGETKIRLTPDPESGVSELVIGMADITAN